MNYNYYHPNNQNHQNRQTMQVETSTQYNAQQHQSDFNNYFGKLFNEHLQTSANFILMFEDGSEIFISLPQTALVRDLYQDIVTRLEMIHAPLGIYTDYVKTNFIPYCNETLQNMVTHFKLTSFIPQSNSFTIFKLYIHIAPQNKHVRSINANANTQANTHANPNNLMINGKSVNSGFKF